MTICHDTASKRCTKCRIDKPLASYGRHAKGFDGLSTICKQCRCLHEKQRHSRPIANRGPLASGSCCERINPATRIIDDFGHDWSWAFVVFRPIAGCENAMVGSNGGLWTTEWSRFWPLTPDVWHPVTISINPRSGQRLASLRFGPTLRKVSVHKIVLEAFVGSNPPGMEGCHDNGDPGDNRVSNLRWDTHLANMSDMVRHGMSTRGEKSSSAILKEEHVREIRRRHAEGEGPKALGLEYGVKASTVRGIVRHEKWKHVI